MSKIVVLAEKPSVGRDIAKVLNCSKKGNGYFEGDKHIVTWALGHLVTLADPEVYDEKYKAWRLEDLPMLPPSLKLIVIKKTGKQFQIVKGLLQRNDVTEIVIATDAGREGELVARWIIEKAKVTKPIKRLWISSVTDKAIKQGFQQLKNGREYDALYAAAQARAEADWYVGINATRALTCRHHAQLSCGRVQTPTLAMLAQREKEIKAFIPKPFYGLVGKGKGLSFQWREGKSGETRVFDKQHCLSVQSHLEKKQGTIKAIKKKHKKIYAPALYDLTELQRDANKRFGFSAKETLSTLQRLYEQHKLVTYPRTDSRYLSDDLIETLHDRLKAISVGSYKPFTAAILKESRISTKGFVDNQKVSDHHAIIPTEEAVLLSALSDKERKLYDLIVRRFLAVMLPPYEYEEVVMEAEVDKEIFTASGNQIIASGWKAVYEDNGEKEQLSDAFKQLKEKETFQFETLTLTEGKTSPPPLFNEGTLLTAMENPVSFMKGEAGELKKAIGRTGGLGTVATRADIIEKLFNSFLIEKKGKDIVVTSKGKQLLELVPEDLKSPALTAEWEQKLELISRGSLDKKAFIVEMKKFAKHAVEEITETEMKFKHDNITGTKCQECGKLMLEVKGKKGKMLVCQDRDCGHRKNVMKISNARCPNCKKKLELHGQGEGQTFRCKCGHTEKLSTFQERRKNNKHKNVSKKEVANFLKKQETDEPINTALADALKKWKK